MDRIAINKYPIEKEFSENFSGINRKVEGKTRVIKKFIWLKKLKGKWKFLEFAYVLQECVTCRHNCIEPPEWSTKWLEWKDIEWTGKQTTFLNCGSCNNELTASGSFISDKPEGVKYKCTDCGRASIWDFDIAPVAIEVLSKAYCYDK